MALVAFAPVVGISRYNRKVVTHSELHTLDTFAVEKVSGVLYDLLQELRVGQAEMTPVPFVFPSDGKEIRLRTLEQFGTIRILDEKSVPET